MVMIPILDQCTHSKKHAGNWTQITKITADDGKSNKNFGYSVDIDGVNVIAADASQDDGFIGSVYLNMI
jgi:hypothetical protein